MIIFKNEGLIDMRAVRTMGASVKSEGAIGYFGTGLKYAIAVLLREGQQVTIYKGKKAYTFEEKSVKIRGEAFSVVTMNGVELGFTTQLGKNWEIWQAFRELYCNCTDEAGVITKGKSATGEAGYTTITVSGDKIEKAFDEKHLYFIEGPADIIEPTAEIHLKPGNAIFYKGVNVGKKSPYMFTYNIKKSIDLTEDRTALYDFQIRQAISEAVSSCSDEGFIERILTAPAMSFEASLDFDVNEKPSEAFVNVCRRLAENHVREGNKQAIKYARKHETIEVAENLIELNEVQEAMLKRATELLDKVGYNIEGFPVKCVETLGFGVSGQAKEGAIYVTRQSFDKGTRELALTLLEEYWHLAHGVQDETRTMQNFMFDQIGTLIERLNGEAF